MSTRTHPQQDRCRGMCSRCRESGSNMPLEQHTMCRQGSLVLRWLHLLSEQLQILIQQPGRQRPRASCYTWQYASLLRLTSDKFSYITASSLGIILPHCPCDCKQISVSRIFLPVQGIILCVIPNQVPFLFISEDPVRTPTLPVARAAPSATRQLAGNGEEPSSLTLPRTGAEGREPAVAVRV